jgi:hypothetical protein
MEEPQNKCLIRAGATFELRWPQQQQQKDMKKNETGHRKLAKGR